MGEERSRKKERSVGFGRMMAWQLRAVSSGIALMVVGYLTLYCTDTLHMEPALVGILMLVSRLLDGV